MISLKLPTLILSFCTLCLLSNLQAQTHVGIGTDTPEETLDVNGGIKVGHTDNTNEGTIRYNSVSNKLELYTSPAVGWKDLDTYWHDGFLVTPNEIFLDDGYHTVNIGQTSIQDDLGEMILEADASIGLFPANGANSYMVISETGAADIFTDSQVGLQVNGNHSTWASIYVSAEAPSAYPGYGYLKGGLLTGHHYLDGSNNWRLRLYSSTSSMLETRLFVSEHGNVGIGVLGPDEKLDVDGGIKLGYTENTNNGTIRYNSASSHFEGYTGGVWERLNGSSNPYWLDSGVGTPLILHPDYNGISFDGFRAMSYGSNINLINHAGSILFYTKVDDGTLGAAERMRITDEGNVGIGITTPNRNVEVRNYIRVTEPTTGSSGCFIELVDEDAGAYDFRLDNSGTLMWISDSDNDFVGFGDIAYFGNRTSTNQLTVIGNAAKPGGGSWSVSSDRQLKTDIQPYADGLAAIRQIDPVTFRYNGKIGMPTDKEYVGIIAQDMQQIAPYTVTQVTHQGRENDPENGLEYLSFDPSALDFMLINGVKELAAENEVLKAENKALNNRLNKLEALVQQLINKQPANH